MAQITSSTGLISGINTASLINSLIQLDSGPVTLMTNRVTANNNLSTVYASLATQMGTLQTAAKSLEQSSTFGATTAASSDPTSLTANTSTGAAVGTYDLQVARLVTTQQLIGTGFTDATNAKVGAGTITVGVGGGGGLATQTPLADLNGGAGVGRGQFRLTDRSGATATIDTTGAVTLDDVVNDINSATTISVRATVKDDHLVLTDTSGKTASDLIVQDLGTGTSAADLGIVGAVAATTLTGTSVNTVSRTTQLASLNDGRGVGRATGGGNDVTFTTRSGTAVGVSIATAATLGDVVDAINTAGPGKLTATVNTGGDGLTVVDNTAGGGTLTAAAANGSTALKDLGLNVAATGHTTITGNHVLGGLDTTLLSSLNGGAGLTLGRVTFVDAANHSSTVDLSGARTVQDVLDDISNAAPAQLTASLNAAGTGIQITDDSGGAGQLAVTNGDGTNSATALGIAGTAASGQTTVQGTDLKKQWVTTGTLLSTLDGGKGIDAGQFTVTTALGQSATIDLTGGTAKTVGDLLYQINSKGLTGLTASVNAAGNGLLLTDASAGAGHLTVTDTDGTAAADLNLAGTATGTTLDGAYQKTITVGANDTLTTVAAAINAADAGVSATVVSDGSAAAPYRLSLTAKNSGTAGQVQFDSGATKLGVRTLVGAQDAAVFVGGSAASGNPLLVTSGSNQVANVITGVTLNLTGVSKGPVELTVAQDADGIVGQVSSYVTALNTMNTTIDGLSTYDATNQSAGVLLGDSVSSDAQASLFASLQAVYKAGGTYKSLASVGVTVGANDQVAFDQDKFRAALSADPDGVKALFNATTTTTTTVNGTPTTTTTRTGLAWGLDKSLTTLIDPINGTVTAATTLLATETQQFQDRITELNALLDQKRTVLETQFANMETALARLQGQQSALSSIGTLASSSSSSSGSYSSGTSTSSSSDTSGSSSSTSSTSGS